MQWLAGSFGPAVAVEDIHRLLLPSSFLLDNTLFPPSSSFVSPHFFLSGKPSSLATLSISLSAIDLTTVVLPLGPHRHLDRVRQLLIRTIESDSAGFIHVLHNLFFCPRSCN